MMNIKYRTTPYRYSELTKIVQSAVNIFLFQDENKQWSHVTAVYPSDIFLLNVFVLKTLDCKN